MSTASHRRWPKVVGALAAVAAAVAAGLALSSTSASAATPGTNSVTLPLFGAPLTVDLTTDASGTLTNVAVNPADGLTATELKPNHVEFSTTAGTATITVRNRDGRQSVSVRAGSLADITGSGSWTGDVFGTSTNTTVNYTVADRGDGSPDITGVTSSDATAQIGATTYSSDEGEQEARAQVLFTSGATKRTLTIRAEVDTESDGSRRASLKVSLGPTRGLPQLAADAAGNKVWNGQLCDGTPARIDYTVGVDGTISNVVGTPTPASIRGEEHSVTVRFAEYQRVHLVAVLNDGYITLNVTERFRCGQAPGTNATIGEGATNDGDRGTGPGGDDHGNGQGNGRGDDHGNGQGNGQGDDHGNGRGDDHGTGPNGNGGGEHGEGGEHD